MVFTVDLAREEDGRWIAEVSALPGAMAYGQTSEEALARVEALVLRIIADRLEHRETSPQSISVSFVASAA